MYSKVKNMTSKSQLNPLIQVSTIRKQFVLINFWLWYTVCLESGPRACRGQAKPRRYFDASPESAWIQPRAFESHGGNSCRLHQPVSRAYDRSSSLVLRSEPSFSVAGHDVLAITFRTILYHLGRNKRARQVLIDEIFSASKDFSTPVSYSEAHQLPYL